MGSMDKDRKGFALEIVTRMGKRKRPMSSGSDEGSPDEEHDEGKDEEMAEERCGEDLAEAIESRDGRKIMEALRAALQYT